MGQGMSEEQVQGIIDKKLAARGVSSGFKMSDYATETDTTQYLKKSSVIDGTGFIRKSSLKDGAYHLDGDVCIDNGDGNTKINTNVCYGVRKDTGLNKSPYLHLYTRPRPGVTVGAVGLDKYTPNSENHRLSGYTYSDNITFKS
jgi:hypothetical protein